MKEAHHASRGSEPYERGLVRIGPRIYLPTLLCGKQQWSLVVECHRDSTTKNGCLYKHMRIPKFSIVLHLAVILQECKI